MEMDWQGAFNLLWVLSVAGFGYCVKSITDSIKDLNDKVANIPNIYARRDDVKDGMAGIVATLVRIESKLDNKADKE